MAPLCRQRLRLLGLRGLCGLLLLGFVEGILGSTGEGGGTALVTAGERSSVTPTVSPLTSACALQNSASLALFTSQLMTRTSGRHRMLRVCTCIRKQAETKGSYVWVIFSRLKGQFGYLEH